MVAHLNVPSLEPRSEYPSSISYNVVTDVLQKNWVSRVIFTDALNMKSINNNKLLAKSVLKPLAEMMYCYFRRCSNSNRKVCLAYSTNLFSEEERLASSVKKILKKFKAEFLQTYTQLMS
jgi:hypothetical protein